MMQDIKSGEKCVLGGGGGGSGNITCGFQGGGVKSIYIFFGGGSGKIWVINQDLSRPPPLTLK